MSPSAAAPSPRAGRGRRPNNGRSGSSAPPHLGKLDVRRCNASEGPVGPFARGPWSAAPCPLDQHAEAARPRHDARRGSRRSMSSQSVGFAASPTNEPMPCIWHRAPSPPIAKSVPHGSRIERLGERRRLAEIGAVHPQENADRRNGAHRHLARQPEPVELVGRRDARERGAGTLPRGTPECCFERRRRRGGRSPLRRAARAAACRGAPARSAPSSR